MESLSLSGSANEQTAATLQWLQLYFYGRSSVSISRCSMYSLYDAFCRQNNYRPVCKATFGKLIRIQFPFVTSKRLGARGQSKYHYYGIALKDNLQTKDNNDCDYDKPLTRFSRNARLLHPNPNDYHSIIHSMLSFAESPQSTPLRDERSVFVNIYKIHCQCLVDAALALNYSQMRHYIIHFWQQLPNHVLIDLEALKSLDLNLYSTLEDIYLRMDANLDQLKHLNAIASLNPLWLKKALEGYANESVRRLKLEESVKWKHRIKCQIQFINVLKSLDLTQIKSCVHTLRALDYSQSLLINDSILDSYLLLLDTISKKSPTLENIIQSFDEMIKKWGKVFSKELALQISQLHGYALKLLTQNQSTQFVLCHVFLTVLTDYLLEVCRK